MLMNASRHEGMIRSVAQWSVMCCQLAHTLTHKVQVGWPLPFEETAGGDANILQNVVLDSLNQHAMTNDLGLFDDTCRHLHGPVMQATCIE